MPSKSYPMPAQLIFEKKWLNITDKATAGLPFINVSVKPEYQSRGIDYLVQRQHGEPTGAEFKFDFKDTGNVMLESISQDWSPLRQSHHEGWMLTCEAGWLIYVLCKTGDALVISMPALRAWWAANYTRFISASVGNPLYYTYGTLVPVKQLCAELSRDTWRWMDYRPYAPGKTFEPYKVEQHDRDNAISLAELAALFETHPARSEPLRLTAIETVQLHKHLWDTNIMYKSHIIEDKEKTRPVFSLLHTLARPSQAIAGG